MHCYLCFVEQSRHHCAAHALCQHCGAAVCAEHVVALSRQPMYGMAGCGGAGKKMLCRDCYRSLYRCSPSRMHLPGKQPSEERRHWWQMVCWPGKKRTAELPTPEEVIAAAELLLKKQYEH